MTTSLRLCYCCLTTADKVDIVMKTYGKISSLGQIEDTDSPQFITGRILPVTEYLTAPISGKPCVYYEARVEQLVERTDENGLAGEVEDGKVWEFRGGDTVAADFTLFDPAFPSVELYVPGTQVSIKVHATEEIRAGRSKVIRQTKLPEHTKEFLRKHNCSKLDVNGKIDKSVRFREANFEFGEQIAVLGVVKQVVDSRGEPRKVLFPVNYDVFTEEFCKSKGWSDWDRRSWRDLTKKPSIILTDMPDYFQNMKVDQMSAKITAKLITPINLSLFKHAQHHRQQQEQEGEGQAKSAKNSFEHDAAQPSQSMKR
eukprot:CAMPEP_0170358014 /NCGR_PEP_ID=MMETSP0117_2-20130122/2010_1 /TAXON_ID=400756 /ORGANISM="Durinskia baltica, Strain CSIRO CS-38" /LENGTH=312 /DNA_ID=CAMNT_0010612211 /DNA_START=38 /DNA_END=976 /DNA_ORIENTATION=-